MAKGIIFFVSAVVIVSLLGMAYGQPIRMDWESTGADPGIVINFLPDGSWHIQLAPVQLVSGDLVGDLEERITQLILDKAGPSRYWATLFKLITPDGVIEGYYSGVGRVLRDNTITVVQHGEVLGVTPFYADLYQATVTYTAFVEENRIDAAGALVIHPRQKR